MRSNNIPLKELLSIAKEQLVDITTLQNPDFRLEQAEYKKDTDLWEVVVSYLVENTNKKTSPLIASLSDFQFHRVYKRLIINNKKEIEGLYMYSNKE